MVYTSKFPPVEVKTNQTIFQFLFSNADTISPNKSIFTDVENTKNNLTYSQVRTQILKCAAGYKRELNLQHGDVVAVCSPSQVDYPVVLHGAVCAGGVLSGVDQAASADVIANCLEIVGAKFIIAHPETLDTTLVAAKSVGIPHENILIFGEHAVRGIRTVKETLLSKEELAEPYPYTQQQIDCDPAYLYFTSGTTSGSKKAVIITQRIMMNALTMAGSWFASDINMLTYTEFHHCSTLLGVMHFAIYFGQSYYILPHYSLRALCATIEKHKIVCMIAQPYVMSSLAKDSIAREYDISSLKVVICGGATVERSVIETVRDKIGVQVTNAYGMTEALGLFKTDASVSLRGGLGYLAAGFTAKLIDEDGNEVPVGEAGELLVRGPTVTPGYYNNPEATKKIVDDEGYTHTGDILKCDKDGMFSFVRRSKDLIKYLLVHINPSEIENVLLTHAKVTDSAVIGIYNEEVATEYPRAYVQLTEGVEHNDQIAREIQEHYDAHACEEKKLRGGVVLVKSFPRTAIGKIQRRLIRQHHEQTAC